MFKLESYLTPFIMGYIDKYVELKASDFQLSLWGGDATLTNLDLRLDVIESALSLPVAVESGHIHEMRIHVPWTKLGSESVIVTFNTLECKLRLPGKGEPKHTEQKHHKPDKQEKGDASHPEIPPGYLQSYINKILANVNIVVNNLVLKFMDEDIVLSVNVKSAEFFSVDSNWTRSFVELALPELVLRRIIKVSDLTVCLDKAEGGLVTNYQDPFMYR